MQSALFRTPISKTLEHFPLALGKVLPKKNFVLLSYYSLAVLLLLPFYHSLPIASLASLSTLCLKVFCFADYLHLFFLKLKETTIEVSILILNPSNVLSQRKREIKKNKKSKWSSKNVTLVERRTEITFLCFVIKTLVPASARGPS